MAQRKVMIEVSGGVAYVKSAPGDIDVGVVDWDDAGETTCAAWSAAQR